ncbi:MAG TPA: alpha/beta hydrolase, partial [Cellvibrionales bacterium]|nr:alpha/beta hydrolase [Cellvibrionales bacterium]
MSNPKMPIPHYISQEAQDFLKPAITTTEHDPAPQSTEEWLAFVEASNANYAPFVEAITTSTDVSIEKTTVAGVTVRIITPKTLPENKKDRILVNLHGGGYVMLGGDQSIMEAVGMALAGQFKVISVDYRMPPLHPFPAAVDDGLAV